MKSFLTCILVLVLSHSAFASGKLSFQANGYEQFHETRPQVGIAVYQKLLKNVAFNSWAGAGIEPFEDKKDVRWGAVKAQLDFTKGRYTLSPGAMFKDVEGEFNSRAYGFVKLDIALW